MKKVVIRILTIALLAFPVLIGSLIVAPKHVAANDSRGSSGIGVLMANRDGNIVFKNSLPDPDNWCNECNSGGHCPPPCA